MGHFFFDAQNNFQWVSITSILSFIGIVITCVISVRTTKK